MKTIRVADEIPFRKSVDVLNECFGKQYKAWMKATYFLSEDEMVWFPKCSILKDGQYIPQDRVYGCMNTISADGNEIREWHSLACGATDVLWRYVFMKSARKQEYRFVGVFTKDYEKSNDSIAVYRRTNDTIDLSRWN